MTVPGYAGKILYLDLTTGKTRVEETPREMIDSFIGGGGINTGLARSLVGPDLDPFSPGNPIIIGAGPSPARWSPAGPRSSSAPGFRPAGPSPGPPGAVPSP